MPELYYPVSINITPERYLENCTGSELRELDLLLSSHRYQDRINSNWKKPTEGDFLSLLDRNNGN